MATSQDFQLWWAQQPLGKRQEVRQKVLGHPDGTADGLYNYLIGEPRVDAKICHLLGLPTEAAKVAQANIASAAYTRKAFHISLWALGIVIVSAILTLVALFK
jgi:hypothetical protein